MMTGLAMAQVEPADDPCDANYFESLKSRAWLEAQREITQNQNLIFKPDSVLEYTCFDRYLNELAQHAEDMFSEYSGKWGVILPKDSMDKALDSLIGDPLFNYINANFEQPGYDLLGGRLNAGGSDDAPQAKPNEGQDHAPGEIRGGSYSCDIMNQVWMQAKCFDFIDNPDEDGFYTFEHYETAAD